MSPPDKSLPRACPFCGSAAILALHEDKHGWDMHFSLGCSVEDCAGHAVYSCWDIKSKGDAIVAWNMRAASSAIGAPGSAVRHIQNQLSLFHGFENELLTVSLTKRQWREIAG